MSIRKYRPSNGTEGMQFESNFCEKCIHQHPDPDNEKQCMILCNAMCHDIDENGYPLEWQYDASGHPTCTAYVNHNWGRDDDGNWIDPPDLPDDGDPNQLMLFSLADDVLETHKPAKEEHA